jgi:hypothetical protein
MSYKTVLLSYGITNCLCAQVVWRSQIGPRAYLRGTIERG